MFEVDLESMTIKAPVTRLEFEGWIAEDVARIGRVLDETLEAAGIAPGDVDHIVATGGTSRVPAVRAMRSLVSAYASRFVLPTCAVAFQDSQARLGVIGVGRLIPKPVRAVAIHIDIGKIF